MAEMHTYGAAAAGYGTRIPEKSWLRIRGYTNMQHAVVGLFAQ